MSNKESEDDLEMMDQVIQENVSRQLSCPA